eukprot:g2565.t1
MASGTRFRDAAKTRLAASLADLQRAPAGASADQRDRTLRAAETGLRALLILAENLCKGAINPKYRRIRRENPAIRRKLLDLHGGVRALKNLGFSLEEPTSEFYEWCQGEDGVEPAAAVEAIRAALKDCENESLKLMRRRMRGEEDENNSQESAAAASKKPKKPKGPSIAIKIKRQTFYFPLPAEGSDALDKLRVSDVLRFVEDHAQPSSDLQLISKGKVLPPAEFLCSLQAAGKGGSRLSKLKIKALVKSSTESKEEVRALSKRRLGEAFLSEHEQALEQQRELKNKLALTMAQQRDAIAFMDRTGLMPPPGVNASEMMAQMLGGTEVMPSQIMGSMSTGGAPDMSSMPPEVMMRMMEMQGGSGDMFSSPPGVGPGGAPPGGWGEGLGPNGGIGGGPTPGEAVPNAPSIRLYEPGASSTSSITLSEMFDGEVITCLAFGSCSCNMFRESQREYERMARELGGERRVRFITVYISEAHPKDGWSFGAMNG